MRRLTLIAILLGGLAAYAWWVRPWEPKTLDVTVEIVTQGAAREVLAVNGQIVPADEVVLGAPVSGQILEVVAKAGDAVSTGDVLARLDDTIARAARDQAEASLESARIEAEAAQTAYDRATALAGTVSAQTRDSAKFTAEAAAARVRQLTAALDQARRQLALYEITAPIDGVIASVSTQEGETVAAGLNAPTFVTIIDLGRLQVDTFVDEVDIGKVEVGQETMFTVDTFASREFKGRVSAIYPKAVLQENVVNYDVVVTITSDYENLLRPEMTTNVTIYLQPEANALVIPSGALQRERRRNIVYLQSPDGPEAREVKVGRREGQWVQILEGLSEGQTIFLEPPASAGQSESDL